MAGQLVETAGIVAKIRADTRGFVSGLRQSKTEMKGLKGVADSTNRGFQVLGRTADSLGRGLDRLNKQIASINRGLRDVSRKARIGFVGVAGAIGGVVKVAADFERQMVRVGQISSANVKEFSMLEKTARDAGRTTVFSATEAAMALENLALAGFSATQSAGALNGTLNLAAAFNLDLADATEMVAAQIKSFQLEATDAGRVSNVLAAGISNSMASFEKLQFAMRYTAPLFNAANKSIEDNVAALGLLFNAGFRGEQAGTSLRMAMTRLIKPTAEGESVLKKYGIALEDVNPETNDFADVLRRLEPLAKDTSAAMALFSVEAGPGMQAMLAQGADAFADLRDKITDTTKAQEMAEAQNNTLHGQFKLLRSVIEEGAIALGNQFIPFVRNLTQGATALVERFNALDDPTKKLIAKWAAGAGIGLLLVSMVSALGFALFGLQVAINAILRPIQLVLKGFAVLGTAITSVVSAVGLGTIGWIALIAAALVGMYLAWKNNWGGIRDLVIGVWEAIKPHWEAMKEHITALIEAVKVGDWEEAWNSIQSLAIDAWNAIKDGAAAVWDWLEPKLKRLDELTGGVFTTTWKWVVEAFGPLWEFIRDDVLPVLSKAFSTTWNWLIEAGGAAFAWIKDTAIPWMREAAQTAWTWTLKAAGAYLDWIKDTVIPFYTDVLRTVWNWGLDFLGTSWTWLRDTAWPVISNGASTAWAWSLEFLGDAWTWLRDTAWPTITKGAATAWRFTLNALGDLWAWLKDTAWPVLSKGIASTWEFSVKALGALWEWLRGPAWSVVSEGARSAWNFTLNALGGLWAWLQDVWPDIKAGLSSAWNFTVHALGEFWGWLRDTAWPIISSGSQKAFDFTLNLLGDMWAWVKDTAWPIITTGAAKAFDFTLNLVGDLWTWLRDTAWPILTTGADKAFKFTLNLVGDLWEWLRTTAWPVVSSGAQKAFDFTLNLVGEFWTWLKDIAWPVISNGAEKAFDFTLNLLGDTWTWIKDTAWPILTEGTQKAFDFTLNLLGETWDWLRNTAWPVISTGLTKAWDFGLNLTGDLWDWVRNTAWPIISSGSKMAWDFGLSLSGDTWTWVKDTAWPIITQGSQMVWDFGVNLAGETWEWVRDAWPVITEGVAKAWDFGLNLTGGAWEWIQDTAWPVIVNGADKAWNFSVELAGELWEWVQDTLWPILVNGAESTWRLGAELLGDVWNWIRNTGWDALTKGTKTSWEFTLKTLGPLWDWVTGTGWDMLTKGVSSAWEFTLNTVGAAWDTLNDVWDVLTVGAQSAWSFTLDGLEAFREGKGFEFIQEAWNSLKTWDGWADIGQWLVDALKGVGQYIWDGLKADWQATVAFGKLIVDSVMAVVDDLKTAGVRVAANMWLAITDWWDQNNPFKSIAGMIDIGLEWGAAIVDGIRQAFSNTKNFLLQLVSNMIPDGFWGNQIRNGFKMLGLDLPEKAQFKLGGPTGAGPTDAVAGVVHRGEYVIPAWMVKRLGPFIKMLEGVRTKGFKRGGSVGYQEGGNVQGGIGGLLASIGLGDLGQTLQQVMSQLGQFFKQMVDLLMELVPEDLKDKVRELSNFWNGLFEDVQEGQETTAEGQKKVADAHNDATKEQAKNISWLQKRLKEFRDWLTTSFPEGLGEFVGAVQAGLQALTTGLVEAKNGFVSFIGELGNAVTLMSTGKGIAIDWKQTLINIAQAGITEMGKAIGTLLGETAFKELEKWGARGRSNMPNFTKMVQNFKDWGTNMQKLKGLERQKATNVVGGGAAGGILGFLLGGPLGLLIGAGAGALAGNAASKGITEQMDELQRKLEDTFQQISEFLGTSVNDMAGALTNAFSADTYTGFVKGFSGSLEDMTRNALIQAFMASEAMAPILEDLSQSVTRAVFDGIVDEQERRKIQDAANRAKQAAGEFFNTLRGFSLFDGGTSAPNSAGGRAGTVLQNLTGPALSEFKEMLAPLSRFGEMLELLGSMNMHLAALAGHADLAGTAGGGTVFHVEHLEVNMPKDFKGMDDFLYELELGAQGKARGRGK